MKGAANDENPHKTEEADYIDEDKNYRWRSDGCIINGRSSARGTHNRRKIVGGGSTAGRVRT